MADETVCSGSVGTDYDGCNVPALAGKAEDWGVVS